MERLKQEIMKFSSDRQWESYHNPKNLVMALSVEVSELMEHFQWCQPEESLHPPAENLIGIKEELGDIMIYLTHLAMKFDVDLVENARSKLRKACDKYPVETSAGQYFSKSK